MPENNRARAKFRAACSQMKASQVSHTRHENIQMPIPFPGERNIHILLFLGSLCAPPHPEISGVFWRLWPYALCSSDLSNLFKMAPGLFPKSYFKTNYTEDLLSRLPGDGTIPWKSQASVCLRTLPTDSHLTP